MDAGASEVLPGRGYLFCLHILLLPVFIFKFHNGFSTGSHHTPGGSEAILGSCQSIGVADPYRYGRYIRYYRPQTPTRQHEKGCQEASRVRLQISSIVLLLPWVQIQLFQLPPNTNRLPLN